MRREWHVSQVVSRCRLLTSMNKDPRAGAAWRGMTLSKIVRRREGTAMSRWAMLGFMLVSLAVVSGAPGPTPAHAADVISACVNDTNGSGRLVGPRQGCRTHETLRTWNAIGPQGPGLETGRITGQLTADCAPADFTSSLVYV